MADIFHRHRDPTADKIKRQFIKLYEAFFGRWRNPSLAKAQHRPVHQVARPALAAAVEPRQRQHPVALAAADVKMMLKNDIVLGQRAGFIGTQHVHGAEVLNRVQPLDDHFAPRHGDSAFRQV